MTRKLSKFTLSIAASAVIVGQAYALDPAITNFGYVNGGGNLTIFDASDPTKIKTIAGANGQSVGISPTGAYFYNAYEPGTITKYNAYTGASGASVAMGTSAYGMTLSPDGSKIYVTSDGSLYVIDATTYAVTNYATISTSTSANISPFISPNLLTGTLSVASAAEMSAKGFTNSVNFAGGTLRATGSFTLSNPVYLNDAF